MAFDVHKVEGFATVLVFHFGGTSASISVVEKNRIMQILGSRYVPEFGGRYIDNYVVEHCYQQIIKEELDITTE